MSMLLPFFRSLGVRVAALTTRLLCRPRPQALGRPRRAQAAVRRQWHCARRPSQSVALSCESHYALYDRLHAGARVAKQCCLGVDRGVWRRQASRINARTAPRRQEKQYSIKVSLYIIYKTRVVSFMG